MTNRIGDRPRFPLPNQRFDKGDAENIAKYYEEIISRFTGSIYGQAWGCVSSPGISVVPVVIPGVPAQYHMRFSRCVLLYSVPEQGSVQAPGIDQGPWHATLVTYDPDKESQPVQSLIINAFAEAQSRPWILFKRRETSAALGNKAYWDTALNIERTGAANLEQAEYVEFRLSLSYTSSDTAAGWYRMAYIDSWSGTGSSATPTVIPIHWMDSQYYADNTPPVQSIAVGSALAYPSFGGAFGEKGFNPYTEMPNLAKLLHWIAGKLGQHYSTTSTLQVSPVDQGFYNVKPGAFVLNYGDVSGGWLSTPERGLLELNNDLAAAEQDIIDLNAVDVSLAQAASLFMTRYMNTPRLLTTMYFTPVQGESSDWVDYTFDVRYDAASADPASFAPTMADYDSPTGQLRYKLVPQNSGYKIMFHLRGNANEPIKYMITAVHIVAYDDPSEQLEGRPALLVHQRYVNVPPPLSSLLETTVEFVVSLSPSTIGELTGSDEVIRPFAINIYGRNN